MKCSTFIMRPSTSVKVPPCAKTGVQRRVASKTRRRRDLTVGEAVKAMVLNGLGFVNQAPYLVPMFFQNKPCAS